jgi:hypothetical protein
MNQIKIKVVNSNIELFKKNEDYIITLPKFLKNGTYGYVFTTNYENYCIKIICQNPHFDNRNDLVDYDEIEVIDKIITANPSFEVVCSEYCYGKICNYNGEIDVKSSTVIYVNKSENRVARNSYIEEKKKTNKFVVYEENYVIIMPYYFEFKQVNMKIEDICRTIIKSVNELLTIDLINIDLKKGNFMVDVNNKIKMIDMGMMRDKNKMNEVFREDDVLYYIWPIHKNITHKQLIPYMIAMFMIELKYPQQVYEIKKDYNYISMILNKFCDLDEPSYMFREIIKTAITKGVDYEIFTRMVLFV